MATKAERVKAETQRAAHAGTRKTAPKRSRPKDRYPNPTSHNEASRAAKNSAYELEPGDSPRPSRKSTRRSPTHIKTDSALRITAMNRTNSPRERAGR
jgi:hypothetical protein